MNVGKNPESKQQSISLHLIETPLPLHVQSAARSASPRRKRKQREE